MTLSNLATEPWYLGAIFDALMCTTCPMTIESWGVSTTLGKGSMLRFWGDWGDWGHKIA